MITSDLVSYIQSQIKKNISKDLIILHLTESGWRREDIDEGFLKVSSISELNSSPVDNEIKDKWVKDPYRELPISEENTVYNPVPIKSEISIKIEEQKAWVPAWSKPISQIKTEAPVATEETKKNTPVEMGTFKYSAPERKIEIQKMPEEQKAWTPAEVKVVNSPVPEIKIETPVKVEEQKAWAPIVEKPITVSVPEIKIVEQKFVPPVEIKPVVESVQEIKIETPKKVETTKIWTPMNIKTVTTSIPEIKKEIHQEEVVSKELEILPEQISSGVVFDIPNKQSISEVIQNKIPTTEKENNNGPVLSAFSFNQTKKSFSDFKTNTSDSSQSISELSPEKNLSAEKPIMQIPVKPFLGEIPLSKIVAEVTPENNNLIDNKVESAIISSYQQDINAVTMAKNGNTNITIKSNHRNFKVPIIIFVVMLIVGGLVYAFMNGYIKMPISIIKNDPKIILLNTSSNFNKLKSYKTNTEITLSSPSFANITSGLVNGEAVVSNDRDYFSINTLGSINKNESQPPVFDYSTTIKGSFLDNNIITDIKYDSSNSYIKMPDFSEIVDNYSATDKEVLVPREQFSLLASEFPSYYKDKFNSIGLFNILSNVMANSFSDKFSSSFNDLISSSTMAEKPNESINGQDSYHYEIIVDRQNTKKFLVTLLNTFATDTSSDVKSILEENLGATTVDSFEIWIGKIDSNILQYKFKLSAPLSKVIGLDDKGIADNTVSLDWKTTYSDFDVANEIVMPTNYIRIEDYMKTVHGNKIKRTLLSFDSSAKNLFNAEGSFGKRLNKTGSCTSPDSGSLFSPLGHDNGANTAIASISSVMNELIPLTTIPSVCYSTLKAWAVSSPLSGDPQVFFCVDSSGNSNTLTAQPIGTTCVAPIIKNNSTNPVNMPVVKPVNTSIPAPTTPTVKPTVLPPVPAVNPAPVI